MTDDSMGNALDSVGDALAEIGALLAEDIRADPDGAFMYSEVGDNWISTSLFKDVGDHVIYRHPSSELDYRILDLWRAAEPDKKWNALLYTITGDRFDSEFLYEEGWDPEEHKIDREPRVLKAKYGDKPIDYSDP